MNLNEPISAAPGEIDTDAKPKTEEKKISLEASVDYSWYKSFPQETKSTFNLPFVPQFSEYGNFDSASLSLNGTHANGFT